MQLSASTGSKSPQHGVDSIGIESPVVVPATADDILQAVHDSRARVVLLNVWATWCDPCVEEFPDILRLRRDYREEAMEVIFVSGDFDSQLPAVKQFLAAQGVDFPSYIKKGSDMEFINTLHPRWSGALPATFIYDSLGTLQHFREGRASYEEFEEKILEVLRK